MKRLLFLFVLAPVACDAKANQCKELLVKVCTNRVAQIGPGPNGEGVPECVDYNLKLKVRKKISDQECIEFLTSWLKADEVQ